jgi:hypothetical protein
VRWWWVCQNTLSDDLADDVVQIAVWERRANQCQDS